MSRSPFEGEFVGHAEEATDMFRVLVVEDDTPFQIVLGQTIGNSGVATFVGRDDAVEVLRKHKEAGHPLSLAIISADRRDQAASVRMVATIWRENLASQTLFVTPARGELPKLASIALGEFGAVIVDGNDVVKQIPQEIALLKG